MELFIFGESIFKNMDIQAEKLDIIQWLAGINDSQVIRQFKALKKSAEEIPLGNLSQAEKVAIDKGLQSIKRGHFKLHEDVMEVTKKKYPHLHK